MAEMFLVILAFIGGVMVGVGIMSDSHRSQAPSAGYGRHWICDGPDIVVKTKDLGYRVHGKLCTLEDK